MKIQEAIQLAVENGWEPKDQNFSLEAVSYKVQALNKVKFKERFFLDRNFWIALGKGMGDSIQKSMKTNNAGKIVLRWFPKYLEKNYHTTASKVSRVLIILKPSKIHGVGCFTTEDIFEGQYVRVWDGRECVLVDKPLMQYKKMYSTYCIETSDGYLCPIDWIKMSVGWYLNHSNKPNLQSDNWGDTYYATRKIKAGSELTIDYKKLDPDNNSEKQDTQ